MAKVLKSEVVFKGHFSIIRDVLEIDGKQMTYDYIDRLEASAIIAIDNDDVLILKQYRHPLKRETYDLPAGKMNKGETPEETAIRECEEETGFKPNSIKLLGKYNHIPGAMDSIVYLYFCNDLKKGKENKDFGEECELVRIPVNKFWNFIKDKEVEPIVPLSFLLAEKYDYIK